jgi:hypothetical protein
MYVKNRVSAVLIGVLASGFVDDACGGPVYIGRYRELVCDRIQEFPDQGDAGAQGLKNRERVGAKELGAHGLKDKVQRLKEEVQKLKDEAKQKEAQERAAVEESWKQEFYERVLGEVRREAQKRKVKWNAAQKEAREIDLKRGIYGGVSEKVNKGILGEMGLELEELMQEVRELKALMLVSVKESPGPEAVVPVSVEEVPEPEARKLEGEGEHVAPKFEEEDLSTVVTPKNVADVSVGLEAPESEVGKLEGEGEHVAPKFEEEDEHSDVGPDDGDANEEKEDLSTVVTPKNVADVSVGLEAPESEVGKPKSEDRHVRFVVNEEEGKRSDVGDAPALKNSRLPLDIPRGLADVLASLCGSKFDYVSDSSIRYCRIPKQVTLFAHFLKDNLTGPLLHLESEEYDVCVLPAECFIGKNTLFLPSIVCAVKAYYADRATYFDLPSNYGAFMGFLHEPGKILNDIQGGAGNPSYRNVIQDWVVDNVDVIVRGYIFARLVSDDLDLLLQDDYNLGSPHDLRWLLSIALITASEEGDVKRFRCDSDVDPSEYGGQDGPGYTLKTVKALVILLNF